MELIAVQGPGQVISVDLVSQAFIKYLTSDEMPGVEIARQELVKVARQFAASKYLDFTMVPGALAVDRVSFQKELLTANAYLVWPGGSVFRHQHEVRGEEAVSAAPLRAYRNISLRWPGGQMQRGVLLTHTLLGVWATMYAQGRDKGAHPLLAAACADVECMQMLAYT